MNAHDVDVGSVERGHPLRGEHLVGLPGGPASVHHEEDLIDDAEDRIHVVGHEQDRASGALAPARDQCGDGLLVAQIQVCERLVA